MMRNILKIIFVFLIAFILTPFSSAYNSDEIKNFYITGYDTWTDIFTVPEGKDLYIEKIYINDVSKIHNLQIRNNGNEVLMYVTSEFSSLDDVDLIIKDSLSVIQSDATDIYSIVGFLVSEDEEMSYYINGDTNAWNKHIFDKKDIDFIYFREFIIMFFLVILKFFSIIIGRKINIF